MKRGDIFHCPKEPRCCHYLGQDHVPYISQLIWVRSSFLSHLVWVDKKRIWRNKQEWSFLAGYHLSIEERPCTHLYTAVCAVLCYRRKWVAPYDDAPFCFGGWEMSPWSEATYSMALGRCVAAINLRDMPCRLHSVVDLSTFPFPFQKRRDWALLAGCHLSIEKRPCRLCAFGVVRSVLCYRWKLEAQCDSLSNFSV